MLFYIWIGLATLLAPFAVDALLRWSLGIVARYYPSDMAGPDGWLIDTRSQAGVFDTK
ncbi:hypothetical protein [Shimia ponticola]|uniref:hypothetical protein n=1 Tax=Shimia ponticola TaxID=2582893 RepID=UPI00164BE279|nr:hypothetical protein [Shimia ponticola]